MKNKKYSYALMACAIILVVSLSNLLAGCARQQQYEAVDRICMPDMDKAVAMQIAEDALIKMNFAIDKADPDTGFIRTQPLSGAQFFEFWRKDNVGPENAALSNLHTIRRVVELNVSQAEEKLCVGCDALVYRLSLPQRETTSRAQAPGMFSESTHSLQVLQLRRPEQGQAAWVNLGQDKRLVTDILKRIKKRLVSRTGQKRVATGGEK